MIEAFLEFHSCFLQGLELLLCGWDMVWNEIDVDGQCHAGDELVGGLFQCVVFPGVMGIFCDR
jgi:hypothetical protein